MISSGSAERLICSSRSSCSRSGSGGGFTKPRPGAKPRIDLSGLDGGRLWKEVMFGAVMQGRNFTSVLLFIAAQQHINSARLPLDERSP